jgi:hypothetical protein
VDFEDFVAALPEPAAPPAPKKPRMPPASSVDAHVLQEFPWLLDVLRASKQPKATAMQEEHENSEEQGSAKASDSECEEQSDILDDGEDSEAHFDLDEVVARLEEKREIEAARAPPPDEHFQWRVIGGAWTAAHLGLDYNLFRADGKSTLGRQFLHQYGFKQSCSFALNKFGEDLARVLSVYWVEKMKYFMQVWTEHGQGMYEFSEADLTAFREPAAFSEAFGPALALQQKRMMELRALRPCKPKK